jgi:hypothetical protein
METKPCALLVLSDELLAHFRMMGVSYKEFAKQYRQNEGLACSLFNKKASPSKQLMTTLANEYRLLGRKVIDVVYN